MVNREVRTSYTGVISEQGQPLIQYECCHYGNDAKRIQPCEHTGKKLYENIVSDWNAAMESHLLKLKRGKRRLYHSSMWEHALDHLDFRHMASRSVR